MSKIGSVGTAFPTVPAYFKHWVTVNARLADRLDNAIEATLQPPFWPPNFVQYGIGVIEFILSRTHKTSPGNDNIQYLVDSDSSSKLSEAVCRIVNMSVGLSVVPSAWHTGDCCH